MASLHSVKQKLYRVRHHFEELRSELRTFYESKPGSLVESPAEDGRVRIRYEESTPTPTRFGLICGDCLQCMRSSLDYLVWELVLVAGKTPNRQHMFPVALEENTFQKDVAKRHRLEGINPEALMLIETWQPFKVDVPEKHPLAVLDELTNINKHRRVLIAKTMGKFSEPPVKIPHLFGKLARLTSDGTVLEEIPVWTYVYFQEG